MSTRFKIALLITAALALVMIGCGRGSKSDSAAKTSIDIKGSDTMVNLMSNMAEAYMAEHPGMSIAVTGGGSGTGIAALLNGTTDICASSRKMRAQEIELAHRNNIDPQELVIGIDGLAVFVHKDLPIDSLTLEQLKQIYIGQSTNWKDFGGPDQEISVLSRESNSGTYVYFKEHVLNKDDYTPKALLMPSTATVVQEVQRNTSAIGYGGVAYAEHADVKILHVRKDAASPGIFPSTEAVQDGSYPIARPLFLYVNGNAQGLVKEFLDYCLTPKGQGIVTETGYMAIK